MAVKTAPNAQPIKNGDREDETRVLPRRTRELRRDGRVGAVSSQSRRRFVLESVGLVLGATLLTAGVLEVSLRLLGVETASYHSIGGFTVYDPELGWKLAPARTTIFKGQHFSVRVVHNADGLRDREYRHERSPGRRRILVLGDSVTWCWGVERDECFTERMEALLPDTDVINAGVPGYSTAQELLYYERDGRRYDADVVLLVMSPNDPTDNISRRVPRFRLKNGGLQLGNVPVPRRKTKARQWLQAHSRLYAHVSYLAGAVKHGFLARWTAPAAPQPMEPAVAAAREGVGAAPPPAQESIRAEAVHVEPAAATQGFVPAEPERDSEAWTLTEALLQRLAARVQADGARFAIVLEAMPDPMRRWLLARCASWGVPCLDTAPALGKAERTGFQVRLDGDPHLAAAGQEVLTREILAMLERERLLP